MMSEDIGIAGKVDCSACDAIVETTGGFALPEEWAIELGWTHDVLNDYLCPDHCLFVPFAGSGAYGHWTCLLDPGHSGRHRFRNYTITRTPHIHKGVSIVVRAWLRHKRREFRHLFKYHKWPRVDLRPMYAAHWRKAIWPARYEPVKSGGSPKLSRTGDR